MSAAQPDRAAAGRRVDARSRFDDATHARKRRTHYPTPVVVTMVAGLRACASTLTRAWTWQTSLPRPRTATSARRAKNAVQGERGARGRGPGGAHAARLIRARFSNTRAPGLVRWGALHLLHPHCHCHASVSMLPSVGVCGGLRRGGARSTVDTAGARPVGHCDGRATPRMRMQAVRGAATASQNGRRRKRRRPRRPRLFDGLARIGFVLSRSRGLFCLPSFRPFSPPFCNG